MLVLPVVELRLRPAGPALGGMFVQDGLALFAKRLFLAATFIGLLAGLSSPERAPSRGARASTTCCSSPRCSGCCVLASARDLILLFLAFELMSIPLYVLAGFVKRDAGAVEAALKFFLVGSVSSAVMAYGLSFVYGATRHDDLAGDRAGVRAAASRCSRSGLLAALAGLRVQDRRRSRSTCGCRTRTRRPPRRSSPG